MSENGGKKKKKKEKKQENLVLFKEQFFLYIYFFLPSLMQQCLKFTTFMMMVDAFVQFVFDHIDEENLFSFSFHPQASL